MPVSRREPDWRSELRLAVFDDEIDAAPEEDEPAGVGLPLRWCALLAVLALMLAVAGGGLLNYRRGRTVISTVVRYQHPDGVDLAGCPRDDVCQPLPDAALTRGLPPELAHATVLQSSLLLDSTTSETIRTVQLVVLGELTMTVTGQCAPGTGPVPARDTVTESATGGGPTVLAFVRPGKAAGCSAALIVRVPAGKPVPTQLLRRIADELPAGLVR